MMTDRIRALLVPVSLIAFTVILTGFYQPLQAQEGMASLNGIVTDPSGAVVPGAEVTLENTLHQAARQTETNSAGLYVIPAILPGTYRLVVAAKGFETHTVENLLISSGQGSTLNFALKVGATTQQVTVTEQAPLLETTTATLGSTVGSQMIDALPLEGRNFSNAILTLPGVSPIQNIRLNLSPEGTGFNPTVHGGRSMDNEYMLDGVDNMEILFQAIPMNPPPEAIAEMKVSTGMDSGIYGWASGANINVVTKSGTNHYHGDVWEYLQNGSLNSRSYFSPSVGPYQWNQFGGATGGPLMIPHLLSKNKAWYVFGYYEGVRRHSSGPFTSFVPTAAEENGNFTGDPTIYNPYTTVTNPETQVSTRTPFANNMIPLGPTNICSPQPTCINSSAELIMKGMIPTANLAPGIIPGVNYIGTTVAINDYDNWSARVDHQFGAKDTFFARYSDARSPQSTVSFVASPTLTHQRFTNVDVGETHTFGPTMVLTTRFGEQRVNDFNSVGGPDLATPAGTLAAYPPFHGHNVIPPMNIPGFPSLSQGESFNGPELLYTLSSDAQKTKGRHTLEFGGFLLRAGFITDNQSGVEEDYSSVQTSNYVPNTGYSLASYLMGIPTDAARIFGSSVGDMYGYAGGVYGQDSWQITPKLHLNLGLRWDYAPPLIDHIGSGSFSWQTGQWSWDKTNPITGAPANIRMGMIVPDRHDFQPRIGIAYSVTPKTVLRASYAIYYDNFSMNWAHAQQGDRGQWPFASPQTEDYLNMGVPNEFLQNPFPTPATGSTTPPSNLQNEDTDVSETRSPRTQMWSASIQQQLTPSTKLDVSYFGSHSIHLDGWIADNTAEEPGLGPITARQRWPQYVPYGLNEYNMIPAFYDGLDVTLTKQRSQNLQFLLTYTWSKTLDYEDEMTDTLNGYLTPTRFNMAAFRGPAGFDTTNRFAASYVYDLPVHPQNRLLKAAVGGWENSGIVSIDSGFPNYAILVTDNANVGTAYNFPEDFPNMTCNPYANWTRTPNQWFNTACYQLPTYGTWGNAGKHAIYGPGELNWNATFSKKWPLFAEGRNLEFRAEFYNLPNSHAFSNPGYSFATPEFGTISGTRQGGRLIEFALKIHF